MANINWTCYVIILYLLIFLCDCSDFYFKGHYYQNKFIRYKTGNQINNGYILLVFKSLFTRVFKYTMELQLRLWYNFKTTQIIMEEIGVNLKTFGLPLECRGGVQSVHCENLQNIIKYVNISCCSRQKNPKYSRSTFIRYLKRKPTIPGPRDTIARQHSADRMLGQYQRLIYA